MLKFCVGKKAKTPYYMDKMHIRIYTLEELAYFLYEYVDIVDDSIRNEKLIRWIDRECGMETLAKQLYEISHFDKSVHSFVRTILIAVGIHTPEQIKTLEEKIKSYEAMDAISQKKTLADHMFLEERYAYAIEMYLDLLDKMDSNDKRTISVCHNLGACFAKLFYFEAAASYYEEAFLKGGEQTEIKNIMICKKMYLSEKGYEAFLHTKPEYEMLENEVENYLNKVSSQWGRSGDCVELDQIASWKLEGKNDKANEALEQKMYQWEKKYHNFMMR